MDGFLFSYQGFDPAAEGLREALTSTGNGYLCSRGAVEWESADDVHYPGTYVHGGYNRETTILGGLPVLNEDLVNMPNWLVLQLRIEGEDAVRLSDLELLDYSHELDIRTATVRRFIRFRDRSGRQTTLRQPAVREHGRPPPRSDRMDSRTRGLVGSCGGHYRDRRPSAQCRCSQVSAAGRAAPESGIPTHVRARGHRPQVRNQAIKSVHQRSSSNAGIP